MDSSGEVPAQQAVQQAQSWHSCLSAGCGQSKASTDQVCGEEQQAERGCAAELQLSMATIRVGDLTDPGDRTALPNGQEQTNILLLLL